MNKVGVTNLKGMAMAKANCFLLDAILLNDGIAKIMIEFAGTR